MKRNVQTVSIETPEHFELQFELAGIGARFLAFLVDRLIQAGVIFGLILITGLLVFTTGKLADTVSVLVRAKDFLGQWIIALALLMYGLVVIGYFILFEYVWNGSTPGKRWQDIRVIRQDGRPVSFLDAAIRNILRFIDIIGDAYPLGLIIMFLDARNRRLGDMVAGTLVVVDRHISGPPLSGLPQEAVESDSEIRLVVASMTPEDYHLVTKFLARRQELEAEHRQELAREILDRLVQSTRYSMQASEDPEVFLTKAETLYREKTRIL